MRWWRRRRMAHRRRAKRKPPHEAWQDLLYGSSSTKLIAIAATITAFLYLLGVFQPILNSGPPPFPARAEVELLRTETKGGLDETLELAKRANVAAQQALQTGNDNRLTRLLQQSVQLQALIEMSPNDQALRLLLEQTKSEITRLGATMKNVSDPAITPFPVK